METLVKLALIVIVAIGILGQSPAVAQGIARLLGI
jgi:hypothetical protein